MTWWWSVFLKMKAANYFRILTAEYAGALVMTFHSWKAFRHGFYWPTAKDDAMKIMTKCKECQFFQKQTMKHVNPLQPIDLSWPFAVWGVDIAGILPRDLEGFRFLFIGIDTFTKWMEATPVVNITQEAVVKFLKSIIYRFGVPKRILTDNGTQFKGAKFLRCCADFGIHYQPSSAAHL
jgi:hypothetical protein